MFFLGRKPAVFNKKSAFYKKSKKNEKECWHSCKALIEYILRWWSAASSKDEPNDPERYRSGHNEAVLKTVCPKGRVGSNPTLSVRFQQIVLRSMAVDGILQIQSWDCHIGKCESAHGEVPKMAEGTPLERVQVVNSGARVQIPPSPFAQLDWAMNFKKVQKVLDRQNCLW